MGKGRRSMGPMMEYVGRNGNVWSWKRTMDMEREFMHKTLTLEEIRYKRTKMTGATWHKDIEHGGTTGRA